ncbi:MAG: sarcosine oxidase subunit delta [Lautropia sp.]
MKLMRCPLNGWRGVDEFAYGGEYFEMPDPDSADDETWSRYVFMRENRRGEVAEWWCHVPSALWFIAVRDTGSGRVVETYTMQQWRDRIGATAAVATAAAATAVEAAADALVAARGLANG